MKGDPIQKILQATIMLFVALFLVACTQNKEETVFSTPNFSCENNPDIESRGFVILLGLGNHDKDYWNTEKQIMESDSKTRFVIIYDQNEESNIYEISQKFLADMNETLEEHDVDELVLMGISAGGVTASYSISRLDFSGDVALHTLASPLKGYGLSGPMQAFLGERQGYLRDIAVGFKAFEPPGENVKVYHHKTVNDTILRAYCGEYSSFCDPVKIQNNNLKVSKEFFYPRLDHDPLAKEVIRTVLSCYIKNVPEFKAEGLGNLCASIAECNRYCKNSYGRCKGYCAEHPENELCIKGFDFEAR